MRCHIEMFIDGMWRLAAGFEPIQGQLDRGTEGGGQLEYDPDFALEFLDDTRYALAPPFPVNFDLHSLAHWPPFLLDLLPGGHARRRWVKRLDVRDGPAADYPLLVRAGGNPPGNLRIREAAPQPGEAGPGFAKEEIARREDTFIEYAEASGALVSGATSVQGEAPKFLLVEDRQGRFYPDGALADAEAAAFWLVKYPRGRTREDEVILRNEASYHAVARAFGLRVGKPLEYLSTARGALFIPRFDRTVTAAGVERWGMWSLAALSGSFRFGERRTHEEYCRAIEKVSSAPRADLLEYLRRDLLNVALGNTDNHGRNTVLLKGPGHRVEVAPLFDFAPMFFDPEGIARATRWEFERPGDVMNWRRATEVVSAIAGEDLSGALEEVAAIVANLEGLLEQCGVEPEIRERCRPRIEGVLTGLGGLS